MWVSVAVTVLIAGLLTVWGIYAIGQYGISLFILIPLFIGANSTFINGWKRDVSLKQGINIGILTLCIYGVCLMVFAIEGLICIMMSLPLSMLMTTIGSILVSMIMNRNRNNGLKMVLLLLVMIPTTAFIEQKQEPTLSSVVTSIEIEADLETVWKNVVEFPKLDEPTEFIFKAGIAYPTDATIDGNGIGAIRYCNFTTGSFVEPITIWDEPNLLKFDVLEQPEPMKEISFWDIDAPHLHDYFVSKEGQFKLTKLPNGNTLLEGTTWYYHNIRPEFYWRLWSDYIIHKIHERVLNHIKTNSELK